MASPEPIETDKIAGIDIPKPMSNQGATDAQSAATFLHNPFRPEVYRVSEGVMR
mgnify:CR=1 FL=1|jgi:hypothetical protein